MPTWSNIRPRLSVATAEKTTRPGAGRIASPGQAVPRRRALHAKRRSDMLIKKRRVAAVVAGIGLAGTAVALAVPAAIVQDEVSASIVWTHAVGYDQFCGPEDEFRGETEHATVTGVATGDPRISGDVELHTVLNIAVAPSSTQVGTLRIRDPRTGEWKAQGRFAIAGEDTQSGGLVGRVRDRAHGGGTVSDLIGPFSITFGPDGIVG